MKASSGGSRTTIGRSCCVACGCCVPLLSIALPRTNVCRRRPFGSIEPGTYENGFHIPQPIHIGDYFRSTNRNQIIIAVPFPRVSVFRHTVTVCVERILNDLRPSRRWRQEVIERWCSLGLERSDKHYNSFTHRSVNHPTTHQNQTANVNNTNWIAKNIY